LIVAHMERQSIRELVSYDRDFDQVPGVSRQEP
jgi:predicted nucleic acid-binding protein